jgi:hypothetical protein
MARRDLGMQVRIGDDLLAKVGSRRQDSPAIAIGADCDAALRPRRQSAIALISETAILAQAVPLRQTAAGCRTQYQKLHVTDLIPQAATDDSFAFGALGL